MLDFTVIAVKPPFCTAAFTLLTQALGGPTTPAGKRVQLFNMPGSEVGPGDGPATWGKATANTVNAFDYQWGWAGKSSKYIPFD